MNMKIQRCSHEWTVVDPKDYTLVQKTSLASINPKMCLYKCKKCGVYRWGLKGNKK